MARMRPPYVADHTRSQAERQLFGVMRDDLSDQWTVLHSLGLAIHDRKPWAEADFVLIGPSGVFCIEVKGQRVRREAGKWIYTTRDGRDSEPKYEGPFDQAGGASSALFDYLAAKIPEVRASAVGYGVATPDIRFGVVGPDIVPELVYDADDVGRPFAAYVERLAAYWYGRLRRTVGKSPTALDDRTRQRIVDLLRGDFDARPSLRARVDSVSREMLRLTLEQYAILDGLEENERALIRGGAGTGKTLLAVEEAERYARGGLRVLYLCYNRNLADYVTRATPGDGVVASTLHALMHGVVVRAGLQSELPDASESDRMQVFVPELCYRALVDDLVPDRFDVLIIDEAQDLLLPAYLDVFDALLAGRLETGRWRMFYDPRQDLFRGSEPETIRRVKRMAAVYTLSVNCRNTMPIAVMTGLLSGSPPTETLRVEGDDVEIEWYRDPGDEVRLVSRSLNRLLSSGLRPADIVVLSNRRLQNSALASGLTHVPFALVAQTTGLPEPRSITYATIQGFKGLEADVVLLVDLDDLETPEAAASCYVGASRARALLIAFISDSIRRQYEERARELGRRLAERPDVGDYYAPDTH